MQVLKTKSMVYLSLHKDMRCGYRIYGSQDEKNGHRFNPKKLLLDPYAKAISGFYNLENEPSEKYKDL